MSDTIASPLGIVRLRPEIPRDEAFRFALFCDSRPELAQLPEPMRGQILPMQFKAQIAGHRAQHPEATEEIVLLAEDPVGRLMVDDKPDALWLVDIALLTTHRNRGIGSAVIHALLARATTRDQAVRLTVANGNPASQLYLRLGFALLARTDAYGMMEWRAPSA
jgi:GNAT superfamily N-acetyltransferase